MRGHRERGKDGIAKRAAPDAFAKIGVRRDDDAGAARGERGVHEVGPLADLLDARGDPDIVEDAVQRLDLPRGEASTPPKGFWGDPGRLATRSAQDRV